MKYTYDVEVQGPDDRIVWVFDAIDLIEHAPSSQEIPLHNVELLLTSGSVEAGNDFFLCESERFFYKRASGRVGVTNAWSLRDALTRQGSEVPDYIDSLVDE